MSSAPHYTPEDDAWLRAHYARASAQDIAARFPTRSPRGVRQRAWLLRLRVDKDAVDQGPPVTTVIGHLSERDRAYLAGIIDGEGCIMLARRHPNGPNRRPVYAPYVSIANTSPALRSWLEERLPGLATYNRFNRQPGRWREQWTWMLAGNRQVMTFLREIAPYLVIKREQAELVAGGYLLLSEEERFRLYLRIRALKRTA
jgi:hypothetical protein